MRVHRVSEAAGRSDVFVVDRLLMSIRLAHGDDANVAPGFRMSNDDDGVSNEPQSHEALLAIGKTFVFHRISDTRERDLRVGKVDAVLAQILVTNAGRRANRA